MDRAQDATTNAGAIGGAWGSAPATASTTPRAAHSTSQRGGTRLVVTSDIGVFIVVESPSKKRAGAIAAGDVTQLRETTMADAGAASGSRRRSTDAARGSRFEAIRAAQIRAVGTAFLRARPLVVAPVAAVNIALVVASGA